MLKYLLPQNRRVRLKKRERLILWLVFKWIRHTYRDVRFIDCSFNPEYVVKGSGINPIEPQHLNNIHWCSDYIWIGSVPVYCRYSSTWAKRLVTGSVVKLINMPEQYNVGYVGDDIIRVQSRMDTKKVFIVSSEGIEKILKSR